jgi:hypothetical protein
VRVGIVLGPTSLVRANLLLMRKWLIPEVLPALLLPFFSQPMLAQTMSPAIAASAAASLNTNVRLDKLEQQVADVSSQVWRSHG